MDLAGSNAEVIERLRHAGEIFKRQVDFESGS
jgi:hypothetical protein